MRMMKYPLLQGCSVRVQLSWAAPIGIALCGIRSEFQNLNVTNSVVAFRGFMWYCAGAAVQPQGIWRPEQAASSQGSPGVRQLRSNPKSLLTPLALHTTARDLGSGWYFRRIVFEC